MVLSGKVCCGSDFQASGTAVVCLRRVASGRYAISFRSRLRWLYHGAVFLLLYQYEEAEAGGQGSTCAATIRADSGLPPSLRRRDLPRKIPERRCRVDSYVLQLTDSSDAPRSIGIQAYSQRVECLREERRHVDQREKDCASLFVAQLGNSLAWYRTTAAAS